MRPRLNMKLLFLNPTGQIGGAEAVLLELLAGLREAYPDWRLELIVASDGPLVDRAADLGIGVRVLPFPRPLARLDEWGKGSGLLQRLWLFGRCATAAWSAVVYARALQRHFAEAQPDILQSNGIKMHFLAAIIRPPGVPLLWHWHDYVARRSFTAAALRRCAHRMSACIVANSESVAVDLRRVCNARASIVAIWNAVDLERFSPNGPALDLDAVAGLAPAAGPLVRVGLIATFAPWKGHGTFLKALGQLPSSLPVRAYIVGGPLYDTAGSQVSAEALRHEAARLGVAMPIGFTGFLEDTAPAMSALDLVVHASTDPEPFGMVIAEAMACGRPVVVSQAGGAAELVTAGIDAAVHSPGDAEALARVIADLVADPLKREQLGTAARVTAERDFTRSALTREFVAVYHCLAEGRPLSYGSGSSRSSRRSLHRRPVGRLFERAVERESMA